MSIESLYELYLQYPNVQTDTRKIHKGELFFALKGPSFNGNKYAHQALENGASYAVVDEAEYAIDAQYILVDDVLTTLQLLANYHRKQFNIPFLGITGSNGKTTTKELINAVLSKKYKTYATLGNLNNHIGVPLTILKIRKDAEIAIIEMGANHLKEIEGYCKVAEPNFAIINNCGTAHIEGFGSEENVKKGKGELYDFIRTHQGTIFRNADLDYLKLMAHDIEHQITYGTQNADIVGKAVEEGEFLNFNIETIALQEKIQTHLVGNYNLPNALAAVAVGQYFKIDKAAIKEALEDYEPTNSRSQLIQSGDNQIILDAYNANPSSMAIAIDNFSKIKADTKYLFLGGMKELGINSNNYHAEIVHQLEKFGFKHVYLVGPEFESVKGTYHWFENSSLLKQYLSAHPIKNAQVLIKGSHSSQMEILMDLFK